jgi:hypothetical protein
VDSVAIVLHDPTNFCTHRFEDFVIAIIFGQLVVLVQTQAHQDLGGDGTPTPLPSFVCFLSFLIQ